MTGDAPALEVEDLRVTHAGPTGPVDAVRGVSFTVERGEVFGLVGGSGSGKSTILDALLGLHGNRSTVTASRMRLGDTDLTTLDASGWGRVRGSRIALVPQHPMTALAPTVPIGRQLDWYLGDGAVEAYGSELRSIGLDRVADRAGDLPSAFSGGQLQRLVIAMATFASRPEVLLADEPTSTLDVTVQAAVLDVLAQQRERLGSAMVHVSHDLATIARVCDTVGVLHRGELVEVGPVERIFSDPQHHFTRELVEAARPGRARPADPTALTGQRPLLVVDGLGHRFAFTRPTRARRGTLEGSTTPADHEVVALEDVTISITAGEVLAVVGESGSGKTTLARAMAGALAPTTGRISLDGRVFGPDRTRGDRRLVQLVAQNSRSALNPRRPVGHALVQVQRVHDIGTDRSDRSANAAEMLGKVGLGREHMRRRPARLSGGELARVVLARSLLLSPRVLVLDEPTASLDAQVKAQILSLLATLRDDLGLTIVLITHELAVARTLGDRVVVMRSGRIVETGPVERVLTHPETPYARSLLESEPRPPDPSASGVGNDPTQAARTEERLEHGGQ